MEIVIITFGLDGITEPEYQQACEHLAPAFAAVDGLQSKVWLADRETNSYGGVYTFASEADVEQFLGSQLFTDVGAHPNLAGVAVRRFHVLEEATRITRGLVTADT
jgi:Putative mono-oxygenase ydhR